MNQVITREGFEEWKFNGLFKNLKQMFNTINEYSDGSDEEKNIRACLKIAMSWIETAYGQISWAFGGILLPEFVPGAIYAAIYSLEQALQYLIWLADNYPWLVPADLIAKIRQMIAVMKAKVAEAESKEKEKEKVYRKPAFQPGRAYVTMTRPTYEFKSSEKEIISKSLTANKSKGYGTDMMAAL